MKRSGIIVSALFLVVSCSQDNPEAIQKKIIQNKQKITKLNQQIRELEEQLEDESSTDKTSGTVVNIKELTPEMFEHYITVSGKVEAVNDVRVSPEMSGQVNKVHVDEGETVRQGDLLVSLKTDVTEKNIREVKTQLELASKIFEKQAELWEQNIGSEVEYLQAKTNKESTEARLASLQEQLEMAKIRAPFGGIIEEVFVKKGELASPGMGVVHLVNMDDMSLYANISERYIADINQGDLVEVVFPLLDSMKMELPVSRIGSVIDPDSRTFRLEIRFQNKNNMIKPNQLATLNINDFTGEDALVVPSIIIKQDISGYYLYKIIKKNENVTASKVYIEPGRSYQDETMVDKGLEEGMNVIVSGYNIVKDGTVVKINEERE